MFKRIAVIGAGTMGSGIAGQVANAGLDVLLLDMPAAEGELSPAERALDKLNTSEPPALVEPGVAERIRTGNINDDFAALAECDLIVEAIVERLDIKRDLYKRLAETVGPECVVTSNTSTIPIALLTEGMPDSLRKRFAITHFFNPVRYMRLLELVAGTETDATVIDRLADFSDRELGKGVVRCADTPGFLGNRVGVFALQVGIDEARRTGVSIETADALMGRPMGIPKTGVFGLYDLIGVDLMADVVRSLVNILPADDAFHAVADNTMVDAMVAEGMTGNKGGGGFYRSADNGVRLARQLDSGTYEPAASTLPLRAITAAADIAAGREALTALVEGDDAEARFCRGVLARVLAYAASLLGDVTESPQAVDDAMKLGFNWVRGPFEMIDALGLVQVRALLSDAGLEHPPCLMGDTPFYTADAGQVQVRLASGLTAPVDLPEGVVRWQLARRAHTPILQNASASLYAIEGDLRLIEFHSKANALTDESMEIVAAAAEDHGAGILVHNDAQHYSAGVDLNAFLAFITAGDFDGMDAFLARFQRAVKALKYTPVPVVGAPSGLALGGGFEVLMHCDALVAHVNLVLGLVEAGVGLLPAGGGVKETYRRWCMAQPDAESAAWKAWMNLGYGATGSSPSLAKRYQYFIENQDLAVINRDRLYVRGVQRVRELASAYQPPQPPELSLAGGDIRERMQSFMDAGVERADFTDQNRRVAMTIGRVITGENGESRPVSEDELYQREREGFVELAKTPDTRRAIEAVLGVSTA